MSYHPCIKIHPNTTLSGCPDPNVEEAADNIRVSIVRGVHLVELQTKVREDFTIMEKVPTCYWLVLLKTLLRHYANQTAHPI